MTTSWIRSFTIDGVETTTTTHRTELVEYFTTIPGRTFLDVGAADGYESRAVAIRGAARVVAVEAKQIPFDHARAAQDALSLANLEVRQFDARQIDQLGESFDVVLCFGFLYHLQNPFHFLKRLRGVTRGRLLLETHVAPLTLQGVLPKHARIMSKAFQRVELDGAVFNGKIITQHGDGTRHRGTLDETWTFWLTPESLLNAVLRAGFSIAAYYHELDAGCPPIVQKRGAELGFGQANTKAWIVADATGDTHPIGEPTVKIQSGLTWRDHGLARRLF